MHTFLRTCPSPPFLLRYYVALAVDAPVTFGCAPGEASSLVGLAVALALQQSTVKLIAPDGPNDPSWYQYYYYY